MAHEYLVALAVDELTQGRSYAAGESLPLHCTLMHWFELSEHLPFGELEIELWNFAQGVTAQTLVINRRRLFGPKNDVPVWSVDVTDELRLMHTMLFELLARCEARPKELRWVAAGWNPHITIVAGKPTSLDGSPTSNYLALIERAEDKVKTIRAVFPFR